MNLAGNFGRFKRRGPVGAGGNQRGRKVEVRSGRGSEGGGAHGAHQASDICHSEDSHL